MAGSSKDIIDSLIAKFHAMSDLCKAFENENGILKEQLMHQKQEMFCKVSTKSWRKDMEI